MLPFVIMPNMDFPNVITEDLWDAETEVYMVLKWMYLSLRNFYFALFVFL